MVSPSARDWIFSIKAFLAAMLALWIALLLGLDRPYWAMGSVYIVAHPLTGATRSKSLYRVVGTLLGAVAAVVLVPMLVNAPALLLGAVAIWVAVLLYVALLHRTPRSYLFMLSAYTLPLVALPAVDNPATVFDLAVSRSQEIILGIVCASVVGAVVFPSNVGDVLHSKVQQWMADAAAWVDDMLSEQISQQAHQGKSRHRLAVDILALDQLIEQLAYDTETAQRVTWARELRGRMVMLLPIMDSLSGLLNRQRQTPNAVEDLQIAVNDRRQQFEWLWADCQALCEAVGNPRSGFAFKPRFTRWDVLRVHHHDHGLLLFSVLSVALAIFSMGCIWIFTGWADGAAGLALGAIACCFFAAQDEPAPHIQSFFKWNVVCLLIALILVFALLPLAHDFEMLVLMLAVPYLVIGLLVAQPHLSSIGMPLAVVTANDIGVQGVYRASIDHFLNGNLAAIAGIGFALVWTVMLRPFGTRTATRRLVRAGWQDIATLVSKVTPSHHQALRARMLDRLVQLVPRLAALEPDKPSQPFGDIRVELSALALQRELQQCPASSQALLSRVLSSVAMHYQRLLRQQPKWIAERNLQNRLFKARRLVRSPVALAALVELQLALFPDAPLETQHGG